MIRRLTPAAILILACGVAVAGIDGTSHDLSAADTNSEVCVFCHTTHGASANGPLWNHAASTHSGSYGVYADPSGTLDATLGTFDANDGSTSSMCMTCHDGTVGIGALVNDPNVGGTPSNSADIMPGDANLGTDLSNDHPVNFSYTSTLASTDGELVDPGVQGASLAAGLNLYGTGGDEVQCATCHDPHSDTNPSFLTVGNSGSALCDSCHMK
jgi:predicted CXXCH cytochrome family protein